LAQVVVHGSRILGRTMKIGDLVRVITCRAIGAPDGMSRNVGATDGDVVLLLENLGERRYHGHDPGLLFRGMLVSSPEDTDYYVFEHDAEVINESR
jgi:hypothetical protein